MRHLRHLIACASSLTRKQHAVCMHDLMTRHWHMANRAWQPACQSLWQEDTVAAWVGGVGWQRGCTPVVCTCVCAYLEARQRKRFEVSVLHVCEVAAQTTHEQRANVIAFVAYGSACACRRMGLALRADDAHGSQQSSRAHTCEEHSNHPGWQKEQETAMRTACS